MPTASFNQASVVEFHFRDDARVLLGRWLRPVHGPELRHSYKAMLAAARPHQARYWLLDLRTRGTASEDDTHWVLTEFLPRLAPRLGERVYVAFVLPPAQVGMLDPENGADMALHADYHVRLFLDEAQALRWLALRQHHNSV
ncbi:hypothetical protein [Hymenobacter weizhouensis]|uniref:hypothetical protein n=1 Tax=Hymenobacter sp. YIM 151500-1 TaxID=2987689 RepID=UPI002226E3A4|nr:hypothetical protein [Hymenobacter sp. YIM 151500-1]UYZ61797.1 hypothetical protein OIS53_12370 [Hymenobacter sp. YIM 151500-1]